MNPFGMTGGQAILTTVIICFTVVMCWRWTCISTEKCVLYICNAFSNMWCSVRNIVSEVVDKWLASYKK